MHTGEYFLGLDMGTNSVGWAVTDKEYHLLRAKGKDLWGVRLFPEAAIAAERRQHRCERRRRQREKNRIAILNDLFAEEINAIDPGFYQRLADSKFWEEDKKEHQPFALFADNKYTDKDYYREYPTVFHLRKAFLHGEVPKDVRLLYLAIHSLYKSRGNFLNANLSTGDLQNFSSLYKEAKKLTECLYKDMKTVLPDLNEDDLQCIKEILSSDKYSSAFKKEKIEKILGITSKNKVQSQWVKLICGMKGKIAVAFSRVEEDDDDEEREKLSLSFRDADFDAKIQKVEELLRPEEYDLFSTLKEIHDSALLMHIMNEEKYLSDARVKAYEKHHEDLLELKKVYKKYCPKKYNAMFRTMSEELQNYSAYVGSVKYKKTIRRKGKRGKDKCTEADLYALIKKDLSPYADEPKIAQILSDIEVRNFLPKQRTSVNGIIPYQVHLKELETILRRAETVFPFLAKKDISEISVSEKIIKTFQFRIPYYIGPLFNDGSHTAWSIRKEDGRIYPWNFENKIDIKKSAEKFMENLIGHCTYLNNEQVLPYQSILYQKFCCLNELNNLKIAGRKPTPDVKQKIFRDLFLSGKKVTMKRLKKYLIDNDYANGVVRPEELILYGVDGDFKSTMSSYRHFCEILGVDHLEVVQEKMAEDIIEWATVYGDSKNFLRERIRETYSESKLSNEQLKRILGIKFQKWGNLSREFLKLNGEDKETGEVLPLIRRMEQSNDNLMELLSGRYTYMEEVSKRIKMKQLDIMMIEPDDLEDMYLSAPVKRMIWQTILIIREICKVMGHAPSRIFVEMTRSDEEKKRTKSRKEKFKELYAKIKDDSAGLSKELEKRPEADFRNKKLYLFFSQMGRSMYTGKPIDLDKLLTNNAEYDLDHIYPRHYVKDDSLDNNLVLVEKQINQHDKGDSYPLKNEIRENMVSYWKYLLDKNLITATKFYRLTRSTPFTDEERVGFINRQMVETSQAVKTVTHLLENTMPSNTKIIYSKAGPVSDFRNKYGIYKCREVNDFHHANDAYLNIVVGNVYHTKFTDDPRNFIKEWKKDQKKNDYSIGAMFDHTVERSGEIAWQKDMDTSLKIVKAILEKQTPLVTYMNYTVKGKIADQTLYSAEEAGESNLQDAYLPLKTSDERMANVTKYGGLTNLSGAYFFLVEHKKKGKMIRTLESLPAHMMSKVQNDTELLNYCKGKLHLIESNIRISKIKIYSKLRVNGFDVYLSGRSNNRLTVINAEQLKLNVKQIHYLKKVFKVLDEKWESEQIERDAKRISKKENHNHEVGITAEKNLEIYDLLTEKHIHGIYMYRPNPVGEKIRAGREKFLQLPLDKQIFVLREIFKLSGRVNGANLKDIGLSPTTGLTSINKTISDLKQCDLVSDSICGIYCRRTNLLTI